MKTVLALLGLLTGLTTPLWAYRAVLTSQGPFEDACAAGTILSSDTPVFILWDINGNGPDSHDRPPCSSLQFTPCVPEDAAVTSYMFYLNTDGGFVSPELSFWPNTYLPSNSLYLAIFFGDTDDSCYTSSSFVIYSGDTLLSLGFPRAQWTCGPSPLPKPLCDTATPYIEMMLNSSPTAYCIETCDGGLTEVAVKYAGQDFHRPPVFAFSPGCSTACTLLDSVRLDLSTWWPWDSARWWWTNFTAHGRGCVTMTWLAQPPVAHLDTFQLLGQGDQIAVTWHTSYEDGAGSYRLWRGLHFTNSRAPVATVAAVNAAGGADYSYTDPIPAGTSGEDYNYLLEVIATTGDQYPLYFLAMDSSHWLGVDAPLATLPTRVELLPAFPNPFNATTRIAYELNRAGEVKLDLVNLLGQRVATLVDAPQSAGRQEILFDGGSLASGVYFCRLQADGTAIHQKLLLLK